MTAEAWALEDVRGRLTVATEQNTTVTVAELREEVGIGHDDLESVLDALRQAGDAVEDAPGEWRGPYGDERGGEAQLGDGEDAARAALDRRDGKGEGTDDVLARVAEERSPGRRVVGSATVEGEVVLTMAIAGALDAETIGKLVEAGIAEASAERRPFVLRVLP